MRENLPLFEALVRVETRLWNQLDRSLSDRHGLSLASLLTLRVLQAAPGSRVQDLADEIDISPGGASKLVDRLVSAELVERTADDADRRVSRLRLTKGGRRAVKEGSTMSEEWLSERFGQAIGSQGAEELAVLLGSFGSIGAAQHGAA